MRRWYSGVKGLILATAFLLSCLLAGGVAWAQVYVPEALQPWQDWVLEDEEYRRCPVLMADGRDEIHVCAWPEVLDLDVDAQGGKFTQRWRVYEESWVPLPGETSYWPRDVGIAGRASAVVEQNGEPTLL